MKRTSRKQKVVATTLVTALSLTSAFARTSAAHAISKCSPLSPVACPSPNPIAVDPPPDPPPWQAKVSFLDQSDGLGFDRNIQADWASVNFTSATPYGSVAWTDDAKDEGTLTLDKTVLPIGTPVGFRMGETAHPEGQLCRSGPDGNIPATGRSIHVLIAAPVQQAPVDLQKMAPAGQVFSADGATVYVTAAQLVAEDDQNAGKLTLSLTGRIHKEVDYDGIGAGTVDASFSYSVPLTLSPSLSVGDPSNIINVSADPGTLTITGDGLTDRIKIALGGDLEPTFRSALQDAAASAVNTSISSRPDVLWFLTLGYTVSVRQVTSTADGGLLVVPSLCKVD